MFFDGGNCAWLSSRNNTPTTIIGISDYLVAIITIHWLPLIMRLLCLHCMVALIILSGLE